jgi:hypothetical protein
VHSSAATYAMRGMHAQLLSYALGLHAVVVCVGDRNVSCSR